AAADAYRRALALRPDAPEALSGYGLALTHAGQSGAAAVALRQAVRLRPGFVAAWTNLGLALAALGRYADAEAAYLTALRHDPSSAEAHVNRGKALKEQGRPGEAVACYDLALSADRGSPIARWNRSLALLQLGDYAAGWPAYESRWARAGASPSPRLSVPEWDGSPPAGRTILLRGEQGLGDVVQFLRYAADLRAAGARVVVEAPAPLATVLAACPHVDEVVREGEPPPPFDAHAAVMSLPALFGTTLATVPAAVPYLSADGERVRRFGAVLSALPGLKVGIAWQGNPHHPWDRHRSVPLQAYAPLAAVPGVTLVSLQRGPGLEQLERFEQLEGLAAGRGQWAGGRPVLLLDRRLPEDEAVAAVDLVVTVDTLTAHLAGAMAVPTWVLLSTMVDWRWLLNRDDSPWYPTVRLFRQVRRDEWAPVFERVAATLRRRAADAREGGQRAKRRDPDDPINKIRRPS
ncbi:MAG: hypothetical protein JWO31_1351, partial [Phycisphaerales bacterium]|nr:hypothetical protein [Phycisphaerales bacterium]